MMPANNGGFHSSFANNSVAANYPQNGMWPGNQFQSTGQFGNSAGAAAGGGAGGGGGHNQGQTNMSGFQCYNSANNGFQAMPPQQPHQQWQHHPGSGSWSGQQWSQNQTRPSGVQGQGQGLPQMKTGDSYQRTCDYVQKCKAWTGQSGGGGGGGSGESA